MIDLWALADDSVREDRRVEIDALLDRRGISFKSILSSTTYESQLLFNDSFSAYLDALDGAALVCAHAACERDLAFLLGRQIEKPARWENWGLGKLIPECLDRGWFGEPLNEQLCRINENRKFVYHHREDWLKSPLWERAIAAAEVPHKDSVASALPGKLREAALDALDGLLQVRELNPQGAKGFPPRQRGAGTSGAHRVREVGGRRTGGVDDSTA